MLGVDDDVEQAVLTKGKLEGPTHLPEEDSADHLGQFALIVLAELKQHWALAEEKVANWLIKLIVKSIAEPLSAETLFKLDCLGT